jgi:ATP-binding cassette subfamily B protein
MKYIRFYRYLLPFWKREVLVFFLSSASMILTLVNPYLAKLIIDKAYLNKDLKLFFILVLTGGSVFILNGFLKGISNYLNSYIKLRITFNLNLRIFKKLQNLAYGFFQDRSTGEHLYKISYDIERVSEFLADLLPRFVSLIPRAIFIFFIILYLDSKIALAALLLTPLLYIGPYYFTRKIKNVLKSLIENSQGIMKRLQEVLSHMQLVKSFGKEKMEIRKYLKELTQNIRLRLANARLVSVGLFVNNFSNRMILGLIIFYGGYQSIKGTMTLGSFSAITIYLGQLFVLQDSLASFFQESARSLISCGRIEDVLETISGLKDDKDAQEVIFSRGEIEFKNITFGYGDKIVLKNLSFDFKGWGNYALVGHSGCGKTTIVNLISRLFGPRHGQILIDGKDIMMIKHKCFYAQLGVVLQEPYLWNDTIENNIRYGKEDASLKEIEDAAEVVCIDNFIETLPNGYRTVIGENACKISEGQKQRIAIARAIIKKPKILILDEAVSSLDSESEEKILKEIKKISQIRTTIIVSHRLSTVMNCDLALFLKKPDTMIIDKPRMLLAQDEAFYNLFSAQIKEFAAKNADCIPLLQPPIE